MSTILIRREVNVAVSAEECGKEFVNAPAHIQAAFLAGIPKAIIGWQAWQSWDMQCSMITKQMDSADRFSVSERLQTLIDYLREESGLVNPPSQDA